MIGTLSIQDAMRAQHTKRWTTVHLTHDQSVAEHTFNVMILAIELLDRVTAAGLSGDDLHDWNGIAHHMLIMSALTHDLDEVITGDIPTPTKRRFIEAGLHPRALDSSPVREGEFWDCILVILKIVDKMESTFHIYQFAAGVHSEQVKADMVSAFLLCVDKLDEPYKRCALGLWEDLVYGKRTW